MAELGSFVATVIADTAAGKLDEVVAELRKAEEHIAKAAATDAGTVRQILFVPLAPASRLPPDGSRGPPPGAGRSTASWRRGSATRRSTRWCASTC